MAGWCFNETDTGHCFSPRIYLALFRSATYSFGSVCLGALLQGPFGICRNLMDSNRSQQGDDHSRGSPLVALTQCCALCLSQWLEDIVECFNEWSYCLVGMYGLPYMESGRGVMELFRSRGWTTFITDNLVIFVFETIAVALGILTGAIALIIDQRASLYLEEAEETHETGSFFGLKSTSIFA